MNRKKTILLLIGLFLGWLGLHRLYLGHYGRTLLYWIYPIALLTLLFWATGTLDIARTQASLDVNEQTLPFVLPIILIPWLDTLWLVMRSNTYLEKQTLYSWVKAVRTIAVGITVVVAIYLLFWQVGQRTASGEPEYIGSVIDFSKAYQNDYLSFADQVVQVSGTITEEEITLREGKDPIRTLIMGNGPVPVKLLFRPAEQATADTLSVGRQVTVKGVCQAEFELRAVLVDCRLIE